MTGAPRTMTPNRSSAARPLEGPFAVRGERTTGPHSALLRLIAGVPRRKTRLASCCRSGSARLGRFPPIADSGTKRGHALVGAAVGRRPGKGTIVGGSTLFEAGLLDEI